MRLRVKNIFIQADNIRLRENKIEILQRLCRPEALHLIFLLWWIGCTISQSRMRDIRSRMLLDCLEHGPRFILQCRITRDAVHYEYRFDGFWAEDIFAVHDIGESGR